MSAETQEEEDLSDEADMSEEDMSDIDMDDDDDLIEDAGAPDISDVEGVPETVDPETEDDLEDCFDNDLFLQKLRTIRILKEQRKRHRQLP